MGSRGRRAATWTSRRHNAIPPAEKAWMQQIFLHHLGSPPMRSGWPCLNRLRPPQVSMTSSRGSVIDAGFDLKDILPNNFLAVLIDNYFGYLVFFFTLLEDVNTCFTVNPFMNTFLSNFADSILGCRQRRSDEREGDWSPRRICYVLLSLFCCCALFLRAVQTASTTNVQL